MQRKYPDWVAMPPELISYLEKLGRENSEPVPETERGKYLEQLKAYRAIQGLAKTVEAGGGKSLFRKELKDLLAKSAPDKPRELFEAELALMDLLEEGGKLSEVLHPSFNGMRKEDVDGFHSLLRFKKRFSEKAADHAVRLLELHGKNFRRLA
jgi:hypothetical protein